MQENLVMGSVGGDMHVVIATVSVQHQNLHIDVNFWIQVVSATASTVLLAACH